MNVLDALLRELPPKLRTFGASEEIIRTLFLGTRVEAGRIRLSLDGGSPAGSLFRGARVPVHPMER